MRGEGKGVCGETGSYLPLGREKVPVRMGAGKFPPLSVLCRAEP